MNSIEYNKNNSTRQFSNKQKRNLIVFFVSLFPLLFTGIIFTLVVFLGDISFPKKITAKSEYGEIVLPINKSTIDKKFTISGTLNELPAQQFIYLVENRETLFWPKYALGNTSGTWKKQLTAHTKKGQYSTYLLAKVDKKGQKIFENWFKTSRKTGKYPGMKQIEFAEAVAKIRVKTK
jgi:hypothetical protein